MIKVEFTDDRSDLRQRVSKAGKPYQLQAGYVYLPNERYPVRFEIFVGEDGPYPPGNYTLRPESFYVGDFSRLEIRPIFQPMTKPASKVSNG